MAHECLDLIILPICFFFHSSLALLLLILFIMVSMIRQLLLFSNIIGKMLFFATSVGSQFDFCFSSGVCPSLSCKYSKTLCILFIWCPPSSVDVHLFCQSSSAQLFSWHIIFTMSFYTSTSSYVVERIISPRMTLLELEGPPKFS